MSSRRSSACPDSSKYAEAHGYTVFFLTGRPQNSTTNQFAGAIANLATAGYDVNDADVYLKNPADPWLSSCSDGSTSRP